MLDRYVRYIVVCPFAIIYPNANVGYGLGKHRLREDYFLLGNIVKIFQSSIANCIEFKLRMYHMKYFLDSNLTNTPVERTLMSRIGRSVSKGGRHSHRSEQYHQSTRTSSNLHNKCADFAT